MTITDFFETLAADYYSITHTHRDNAWDIISTPDWELTISDDAHYSLDSKCQPGHTMHGQGWERALLDITGCANACQYI